VSENDREELLRESLSGLRRLVPDDPNSSINGSVSGVSNLITGAGINPAPAPVNSVPPSPPAPAKTGNDR
jgi:hypothetical protein